MNRGRDSYYKDDPEAEGCSCSYNFYFMHNNLQSMKESSSRIGKTTIKYAYEKDRYLWENDPIYREKIRKIRQENGRKNGKISGIKNVKIMNQKEREKYENDPEYRKRIQQVRSKNAKNYLIPYWKEHKDQLILNNIEIRKPKFCEKCNKVTPHNGSFCLICHPESNCATTNIIQYSFCFICNQETPHDLENNCQVCSGEKIWCEHCQKFETISYNSIQDHWVYYKSRTLNWIKDNKELVEFLENYIGGFDAIIDKNISGIYCWYVCNKPWYIGQSADILSRSYDHMKSFYESPEYFDFYKRDSIEKIINDESYNIKVEVLEECNQENLNEKEIYWINKLKPLSQLCDSTDHIIPLNQRNFN